MLLIAMVCGHALQAMEHGGVVLTDALCSFGSTEGEAIEFSEGRVQTGILQYSQEGMQESINKIWQDFGRNDYFVAADVVTRLVGNNVVTIELLNRTRSYEETRCACHIECIKGIEKESKYESGFKSPGSIIYFITDYIKTISPSSIIFSSTDKTKTESESEGQAVFTAMPSSSKEQRPGNDEEED